MKTIPLTQLLTVILVLVASSLQSNAMYSVGPLTKEEAKKSGVILKSRPNGDAGTQVWLEIKKDGPLGNANFFELRMKDSEGKHLLSNRIQPHPVTRDQAKNIITISFSAKPSQLSACSFWIYKGGSLRDSEILTIKVSDFLEVQKEPSQ